MALEDVKIEPVENDGQHSEEQIQKIQDWIENPITKNLSKTLIEAIEKGKEAWMAGAYLSAEKKTLGDWNSGFHSGLKYVLEFLLSGGISKRDEDGITKSDK